MASARTVPFLLLAASCLAWPSNALVVRRGQAHMQRSSRVADPPPPPTLPIDAVFRRAGRCERAPFALHAKNDDRDSDSTQKEYSGVVEDGSPLGVAIVVLGSLLLLNGDEALQEPGSPAVLAIFATASVAAGLARLYRYLRDKGD